MSTATPEVKFQSEQHGYDEEIRQTSEGPIAKAIEQQTAKLPSDTFLWAALASIGASAIFQLAGKKETGLFIGQWVSPLLLFGVYNKIVKVQGSDRQHQVV